MIHNDVIVQWWQVEKRAKRSRTIGALAFYLYGKAIYFTNKMKHVQEKYPHIVRKKEDSFLAGQSVQNENLITSKTVQKRHGHGGFVKQTCERA